MRGIRRSPIIAVIAALLLCGQAAYGLAALGQDGVAALPSAKEAKISIEKLLDAVPAPGQAPSVWAPRRHPLLSVRALAPQARWPVAGHRSPVATTGPPVG